MSNERIDTLNALLRGELSAVQTYQQALAKLGQSKGSAQLRWIQEEHVEAVARLRQEIETQGGSPEQTSGAWGAFAKAVEGTAKWLGNAAAIKALKEGEEHGIKEYERALAEKSLAADFETLIRSTILPQAREHIPALDRLMAGLVERIAPQEARRRLQADPEAMLVCAYDSQEKFDKYHLEGAISFDEFKSQVDSLPEERELIFYCA